MLRITNYKKDRALTDSITNPNKNFFDVLTQYLYIIIGFGMLFIIQSEYRGTSLFYITIIVGAVIFAALSENCKISAESNLLYTISFLMLYFVLGFRNYSGIDDSSYIKIFNNVLQNGWYSIFKTTTIEPGYLLLNFFVSKVTDNYLYMQLITSFIPLFLFYKSFRKYKGMINIPLSVFLLSTMVYFQMLSASLIRMFIAMSIVFYAFYYIPKKQSKRYVILILIASTFHYSSLFMLILLYFSLNKDNLSEKARRFILVIFTSTPIIFLIIARVIVPLIGSRYSQYGIINSFKLSFSSFDTLPMLILLLLFYRRFNGEKRIYFKLFVTILGLSMIMSIYSSMISLGRLIFYANIAIFIAAPMVSKELQGNFKKIIFSAIVIAYGFAYLYVTQFKLESHIPYLFPYQSIFFNI